MTPKTPVENLEKKSQVNSNIFEEQFEILYIYLFKLYHIHIHFYREKIDKKFKSQVVKKMYLEF